MRLPFHLNIPLILVLGAFGMMLVSYQVSIKPKLDEYQTLKQTQKALAAEIESLSPYKTKVINQPLQLLQDELLTSSEEMPALLESIAQETHLQEALLESFETQAPMPSDVDYLQIPFSLSLTGHQEDFTKWLAYLAKILSLFSIENFTFANSDDEKISLKLQGFFYTTPTLKPPVQHEKVAQRRFLQAKTFQNNSEIERFRLVGILKNSKTKWALIVQPPSQQVAKIEIGQFLSHTTFKVTNITDHAVELTNESQTFQLSLPPLKTTE